MDIYKETYIQALLYASRELMRLEDWAELIF